MPRPLRLFNSYLFIYLLSIYQKDGYNTKGEPVQGAIQHTTTTNTQHDMQQVHKQNKQRHYKNTKIWLIEQK